MLKLRTSLLTLIAVATVATVITPAAASAAPAATTAAKSTTCPGTFTVLANDRIGSLVLKAGPYTIIVAGKVTCNGASTLFTRFLQDWDGKLPSGWVVHGRGFKQGTTGNSFAVRYKGVTPPPGSLTCPGHFTLRANDTILKLKLPKGNYIIKLLKHGKLICPTADSAFALFLTKYRKGPLPKPWSLSPSTRTFKYGGGLGFTVTRTGGGTGGGGQTGVKCPATFHILHDDQINTLKLKAGFYYQYVIGALTCKEVANDLTLDLKLGKVPANWTLNVDTATFLYKKTKGFRLEPVKGAG
jgi:hypothetical protein